MGTHEELTARCPQYRLLLSGPGDDAEGTDAGELDYYRETQTAARGDRLTPDASGITPALWPQPAAAASGMPSEAATRQLASAAASGIGRGRVGGGAGAGGGRGGGAAQRGAALSGGAMGGGWMAGVPASPELIARVDALPPATEVPAVDEGFARAPDPRFTLGKLLRPFAIALGIGLLLDALDAVASTVMPAAGPRRHRQRRRAAPAQLPGADGHHLRRVGHRAGDRARGLGRQLRPDHRGRAQRRAAALHAAGEDLRPPAAARPGLLRARAGRADHDQDDDRRGRAVVVLPDRPDHDGELAADVRGRADR